MGRAGFEPASGGLKAPAHGLGPSRALLDFPVRKRDLGPITRRPSRLASARLVVTPLPPGRAGEGRAAGAADATGGSVSLWSAASPGRAFREAAAAIEQWPPQAVAPDPGASRPARAPRSLGLASDRACRIRTCAQGALVPRDPVGGGGELVRLLDATDQLGMVRRIDGPRSARWPSMSSSGSAPAGGSSATSASAAFPSPGGVGR
jgi:hypothetical protein